MRLDYNKDKIHFSGISFDLNVARSEIRAAFPFLVEAHVVKKVWENDHLRIYVDWKEVFNNLHAQAHLINFNYGR